MGPYSGCKWSYNSYKTNEFNWGSFTPTSGIYFTLTMYKTVVLGGPLFFGFSHRSSTCVIPPLFSPCPDSTSPFQRSISEVADNKTLDASLGSLPGSWGIRISIFSEYPLSTRKIWRNKQVFKDTSILKKYLSLSNLCFKKPPKKGKCSTSCF